MIMKLYQICVLWLVGMVCHAQPKPVVVSDALKVEGNKAELVFKATIQSGWHMYSVEVVEDGPTPTTLNIEKIQGAKLVGKLKATPKATRVYEEMFGADVFYHEGSAIFTQAVELTGGEYQIEGYLEYGACNDATCIPPTTVEFKYEGKAPEKVAGEEIKETPDEQQEEKTEESEADSVVQNTTEETETAPLISNVDLWAPVEVTTYDELVKGTSTEGVNGMTLWSIFLMGFIGGLLALFTPCVWPIIPMTVSFFLKRGGKNADKKKGIRDAIIYGVSIIVIYLALGLIVTSLFGANALNALSTNAVFNVFFFLLLVVFALSFFGLFEITLPSSWSNKIDSKADATGGLIGIFLMAFTLTLVSFSCTGPIIGFLLVEVSTMGNILGPAVGMFGFALALALPFALFALFPNWLKSMPKSGGWMNTVKVVLGFIELFFAFKFLSVADMAYGWHILDRDIFIIIWILLALALGLYLIGIYHFPHEEKPKKVGIVRWILGLASILFAVYMVPGLWGNQLRAISAFTPPMSTQHWRLVDNEVKPQFHDYEEGMAYAKERGKPVFVDFTGYGCVNCRKMEAAVWTDEKVSEILNNDYVMIQLFVDDKTKLDVPVVVNESEGETRKLRTVGDKWSYLQSSKFGANAQPFYVILDNDGNVMDGSYGYDEDVNKFIRFLNDGLNFFYPATDEGH
ncbi:MAG: thioredoxin family protein [Prevotellaceae bacterium]|nr:thioredoxin family protein [Candidatus Colivivens equi]